MLSTEFGNGKKLNLFSAFALFMIVMGFLFLIAAAPGSQTFVSVTLMILGACCLTAGWFYTSQHHPHSH